MEEDDDPNIGGAAWNTRFNCSVASIPTNLLVTRDGDNGKPIFIDRDDGCIEDDTLFRPFRDGLLGAIPFFSFVTSNDRLDSPVVAC